MNNTEIAKNIVDFVNDVGAGNIYASGANMMNMMERLCRYVAENHGGHVFRKDQDDITLCYDSSNKLVAVVDAQLDLEARHLERESERLAQADAKRIIVTFSDWSGDADKKPYLERGQIDKIFDVSEDHRVLSETRLVELADYLDMLF